MDADTDLFVQAFWVKCRETIRPAFDMAVESLRAEGHEANVSTLEYSRDAGAAPDAAPALVLTVYPKGSSGSRVLRYRGDVAAKDVEVTPAAAEPHRHELAEIDLSVIKKEISESFAALLVKNT